MGPSLDSTINLRELMRAWNASIHSTDTFFDLSKDRKKPTLCSNDFERAIQYIHNPTKNGIWKLNAEWLPDGGVSSYLLDDFEKRFSQNKKDIIESEFVTKDEKGLLNKMKEGTYDRIRSSVSFLFEVFYRCYLDEVKDSKLFLFENVNSSFDKIFYENIDYGAIRAAYQDSYRIFKDEIMSKDFSYSVLRSSPSSVGEHSVFFEAVPNIEGTLTIVSFHYEPLESLNKFLTGLNKIKTTSIRLWFSPEEEIFSPYFMVVKTVYPNIIDNSQLIIKFEEAIEQYESKDFSHCINSLGIISEDYLIQIYETLFRDVCPRVPLGNIYALINREAESAISKKVVVKPKPGEVYGRLKDLEKHVDIIQQKQLNKENLKMIREVFKYYIEQEKYNQFLIDEEKNKNVSPFFPPDISSKITELISYRNATSHKSRTRITEIEAQRMVYCLMSLVTWWNKELKVINWKNDKKTIIKKCIARNKSGP